MLELGTVDHLHLIRRVIPRAYTANMTSLSQDSRRIQRRDSSTRSSSQRRPRLLRASATEPSIATSNASRNAHTNHQSSRRATELLSRVAFISGSPPDSVTRSTSPLSTRTSMFDSMDRQGELSSSPVSHPDGFGDMHPHSCTCYIDNSSCWICTNDWSIGSGRYFSFPSFDMYEAGQREDDEKSDMKSP